MNACFAPAALAVLASVGAVIAAPCAAQERTIALTYDRPADGCPDEEWLRAEVMGRLGRDPFTEAGSLQMEVILVREGRGVRAEVRVTDGAREEIGRRDLEGGSSDCRELASAVALTSVLMLEALGLPEEEPDPGPGPFSATTSGEVAVSRESMGREVVVREVVLAAAPAQVATEPTVRAGATADVGVSLGAQPAPTFAALLGALVSFGAFEARLEGRLATGATVADGEVSASTSFMELALSPCGRWSVVGLCGVASLGQLRAEGAGLANPRAGATLMPALGAAVLAEVEALPWLWLGARAELAAPLRRVTVAAGDRVLWEAPAVRGLVSVGVRVVLPQRIASRDPNH